MIQVSGSDLERFEYGDSFLTTSHREFSRVTAAMTTIHREREQFKRLTSQPTRGPLFR